MTGMILKEITDVLDRCPDIGTVFAFPSPGSFRINVRWVLNDEVLMRNQVNLTSTMNSDPAFAECLLAGSKFSNVSIVELGRNLRWVCGAIISAEAYMDYQLISILDEYDSD